MGGLFKSSWGYHLNCRERRWPFPTKERSGRGPNRVPVVGCRVRGAPNSIFAHLVLSYARLFV